MLPLLLLGLNITLLGMIFWLQRSLTNLQVENAKLVTEVQHLHGDLLNQPVVDTTINPYILPTMILTGITVVIVCGLAIFTIMKPEPKIVMAELSKNSIETTGDYIRDVIVPSVDVLNKASEARVVVHLDNVKQVVAETGSVVTEHVSQVNKDGVICLINTLKPVAVPRVLGKISQEFWNVLP